MVTEEEAAQYEVSDTAVRQAVDGNLKAEVKRNTGTKLTDEDEEMLTNHLKEDKNNGFLLAEVNGQPAFVLGKFEEGEDGKSNFVADELRYRDKLGAEGLTLENKGNVLPEDQEKRKLSLDQNGNVDAGQAAALFNAILEMPEGGVKLMKTADEPMFMAGKVENAQDGAGKMLAAMDTTSPQGKKDNMVSQSEFTKSLQNNGGIEALDAAMDKNQDGKITKAELRDAIDKSSLNTEKAMKIKGPRAAIAATRSLDRNLQIARQENAAQVGSNIRESYVDAAEARDVKNFRDQKALLKEKITQALDSNENGKVDAKELAAVLDTNKDGRVSRQETSQFAALISGDMETQRILQAMRNAVGGGLNGKDVAPEVATRSAPGATPTVIMPDRSGPALKA